MPSGGGSEGPALDEGAALADIWALAELLAEGCALGFTDALGREVGFWLGLFEPTAEPLALPVALGAVVNV
jgi:hypothetical protein